ncbi:MAG TPA: single-stranded-DNA-specific exonuclease RecJ [Anaerovoracaceae bacterium]|nr:single-stranded-DNA-specific exonuclease RecJ [Anaerovoracaceae bacterium]
MNEIHSIIREILENRGITEEADILEFLSEKPNLTYDPFLLKNLEVGVDFLLSSISQNRKICIYGDYDADGVTSISLLMEILSQLTDNLTYYIPSRFDEGYGLNKEAIELIGKQGSDLIVTVDCGSVSYEEVEYGKSIGIDFIVTDHHNINDKPADCILINPKQEDCPYPFKHLAGCGVAFKLAQGIQRKAGLPKSILNRVLDLVAIATIGDIVPLIGENRTLTKYGMGIINSGKRPGLNRLIEEAGLITGKIKSENIAYIIVPHLNAAGRLLDAKIAVELLISADEKKIAENVAVLIQNNKDRKRIQEEAFQKCKEVIAAELEGDLFYIIAPKDIHEGIAGIVAGKIKDEYGRPAIIVTESGGDGYLKGTGRSISSLNLYDILKKYDRLFVKFGGHSGACGFLMKSDNLNELRTCLNREIEVLYHDNSNLFDSSLSIDLIITEGDIDLNLALELEKLAPFGCQNERPLFQIKGIRPSGVNFMGAGGQHVRFSGIGNSGRGMTCILFQKAQDYSELLLKGERIDLAGYPDINVWNGESKIQFVLKCITC